MPAQLSVELAILRWRVAMYVSVFWKLDNQGYNICLEGENLKFYPRPPPLALSTLTEKDYLSF